MTPPLTQHMPDDAAGQPPRRAGAPLGSMRTRLILVGGVVIVAIVCISGLIVEMERRAAIAAFRTAMTNLASGMAQQTAPPFQAIDATLIRMRDAMTATRSAAAGPIGLLFGVLGLAMIGADGRVVATFGDWPASQAEMSGSEAFRRLRDDHDQALFVGAPVRDASGTWTTLLARRVDGGGAFAGIAAATVSLTRFEEFYRLAMPPLRSVYLLRRDGLVLARYPANPTEIGLPIADTPAWLHVLAGGGGGLPADPLVGTRRMIGAVLTLPGLPLAVAAAIPEAVALSDDGRHRAWAAMGGSAAIICVVLLLRLFGRQFRRLELSELSLAAKNAQLDVAHEQLDVTLSSLPLGVCFYDEQQRVIVCNRRYGELYDLPDGAIRPGMALREVAEMRAAAGTLNGSVDEYVAAATALMAAGEPRSTIAHLANGRVLSGHFRRLPGRGSLVTREDITERRKAEARIEFLARHDVLTGLANRTLFQDRLERALDATHDGHGFALLCLDLDRFKAVNDTLGHPVGDALLRAVAARLRRAVREVDTVARLGGDEFAILLPGTSDADAVAAITERIVHGIVQPYELDGHKVTIGASIGATTTDGAGADMQQLMRQADLALYRAKQDGRGTWRFFEPAMDAGARRRHALEADLRHALRLGQFALHYQPLAHANDRRLTGFEALVRWHHPTRGLLPPGDFVPLAEEIGLIGEIGAWVLTEACRQAVAWPRHLRLAVNLSARQFTGQTLETIVCDALRASGLAARRLELEITESVQLQEGEATLSQLHSLRALGVRIALDDFGTGFSSLSYLRRFPFDGLKIDRSFVADLSAPETGIAVIRGLIALASNLRMTVTAEGVEAEWQRKLLAAAGCTEIQGYLISRPVRGEELPALIERLAHEAAAPPLSPAAEAVTHPP